MYSYLTDQYSAIINGRLPLDCCSAALIEKSPRNKSVALRAGNGPVSAQQLCLPIGLQSTYLFIIYNQCLLTVVIHHVTDFIWSYADFFYFQLG